MLDVLEYGLDRATDPNENKVNQVRQHLFTAVEFVWEDPNNVPRVVFLGGTQAVQVSSAVTAKWARS